MVSTMCSSSGRESKWMRVSRRAEISEIAATPPVTPHEYLCLRLQSRKSEALYAAKVIRQMGLRPSCDNGNQKGGT